MSHCFSGKNCCFLLLDTGSKHALTLVWCQRQENTSFTTSESCLIADNCCVVPIFTPLNECMFFLNQISCSYKDCSFILITETAKLILRREEVHFLCYYAYCFLQSAFHVSATDSPCFCSNERGSGDDATISNAFLPVALVLGWLLPRQQLWEPPFEQRRTQALGPEGLGLVVVVSPPQTPNPEWNKGCAMTYITSDQRDYISFIVTQFYGRLSIIKAGNSFNLMHETLITN